MCFQAPLHGVCYPYDSPLYLLGFRACVLQSGNESVQLSLGHCVQIAVKRGGQSTMGIQRENREEGRRGLGSS